MTGRPSAVRVTITGGSDLVAAGLTTLLEDYRPRVVFVDWADVTARGQVDVVLLEAPIAEPAYLDIVRLTGAKVVRYARSLDLDEIEQAIAAGAAGFLWQGMPGDELVEALEEIVHGEALARPGPALVRQRLMVDFGLSRRETQILTLVARGMSNQEIADLLHVSINSVKTYIRSAYRKIGVTTRSQAVGWALSNGLQSPVRDSSARPAATPA